MINRVLINASAAKAGGALTILNRFCFAQKDKNDFYIILSPIRPDVCPKNSVWIEKKTNGLSSMLFTLIFSWFYVLKYRCNKIISFSNFNTIFPVKDKVTYFHNFLIFVDEGFRYKIIRYIIRNCFQKNTKYIFQTPFVKAQFFQVFGFLPDSEVCWPGINVDKSILKQQGSSDIKLGKFNILVPIIDINCVHKNFKLVIEIAQRCPEVNFFVTSHIDHSKLPKNIKLSGVLENSDFFNWLNKMDGILITSEYETLSLPIFEALLLNKPAFVLEKDYLTGLELMFGEIKGLHKFNDADDFFIKLMSTKCNTYNYYDEKYTIGSWNF